MKTILHFGVNHGSMSVGDVALSTVLFLTGIASAIIVGLAIIAFAQRRSRSYLLITMALVTLLARTGIGGLAIIDVVPMEMHHIIEHSLDGAMAVLLIAAVYYARTTDQQTTENHASTTDRSTTEDYTNMTDQQTTEDRP